MLKVVTFRASITERLFATFTMRKTDELDSERHKRRTGVTYQIVSHLPKSSEQLETRESLANLAVSHGETYIGTPCIRRYARHALQSSFNNAITIVC